ncbi:SPOR domain-containing protein [Limnohabitans lacus]|uniref:SPOR domain-containing protein n=1 Tax=Limnohabitans lacus TaxID=3045173 RepID=A0ABT6XAB3_9BURK|nr:hypothetical protein [Limnohabitans sp. HM2-2]MDI9235077.1 hypothetical protein [Limnohabitans sp. HM2-2]
MTSTYTPASLAIALVDGVRSLGLVSQLDAPLKSFTKRLLTCVRSIDDAVVVEEFRGHEFLNLISRLNQEVAPHLVQQELPFEGTRPLHVWVIDQAHLLAHEQQSIIFRLIELFPALPFRVIWLSNQPLQAWREHGRTECIFLDLDAVESGPMDLGDATEVAAPLFAEVDPDAPATASPANHGLAWPAQGMSPRVKITAAALGVSILGGLAWMSATTSKPSAESSKAPAEQISAVSKASTPVMPAAATPPAAPSSAASASSAAPTSQPTPEATTKPAPEPVAKPKSVPPPQPSTSAALPDVALAGGKWLKALPADTWVVEHGNWGTLEQAQKLKAKYKELGTARIIAIRKSPGADEWQFIVVTGPFRSEVRAKTYISRLDWKANTRIRDTDKLKAQIAP